jgi:hypothetical protein
MKGSLVRFSANTATVLFAVIIVLQLLLAAGILPVTMAWGGTQTVTLPINAARQMRPHSSGQH